MTSSIRRGDLGIGRKPVSVAPSTVFAPTAHAHEGHDADAFDLFMETARQYFMSAFVDHGPSIFTTDTDPDTLYNLYIESFRGDQKRIHSCNCCRQFLKTYGALAFIDATGKIVPAFWPSEAAFLDFPALYQNAVVNLNAHVRARQITGVFLSDANVWGTVKAGGFTHLSMVTRGNSNLVTRAKRDETLFETMALKREHFGTLSRTLAAYSLPVLEQTVSLLEANAVYRTETVLEPARFLRDLYITLNSRTGAERDNLIWRAVATAPIGFVNIRGGVLGTLLDDLSTSMSFEAARERFERKMQPDKFRRPQAAPKAGNIAAAEAKVARLGLAPSLERRYATLNEIQTVWSPYKRNPVQRVTAGSVFANVRAKGEASLPRPRAGHNGETMTWSRFARTVLPNVERMEILVPASGGQSFAAYTTAVHPDSPPILQWDFEDRRNTVAWYLYSGGSNPEAWSLNARTAWYRVNGISLLPPLWDDGVRAKLPHFRNGALFVIDGCRDRYNHSSCLFPEILKSDLYDVRSTIEAHSKNSKLVDVDEPAAGRLFDDGQSVTVNVALRGSVTAVYTIQKWD